MHSTNNGANNTKSSKPPCPAPTSIPGYSPELSNTNPEIFYQYLNKYIYLWLKTNDAFWYYPTDIKAGVMAGYAWDMFGWYERVVEIDNIDSFY